MNHRRPLCGFSAVLLVLGLSFFAGCGTEKEYASSMVSTYDLAKATGTEADMQAIGTALAAYRLDNGDYPAVSGIDALVGVLSPDYIRIAAAQDKWGHPFEYSVSAAGYKLVSIGNDGIKGTADDLEFEEGRMTRKPPGSGPAF
jgi:hypothetical protein